MVTIVVRNFTRAGRLTVVVSNVDQWCAGRSVVRTDDDVVARVERMVRATVFGKTIGVSDSGMTNIGVATVSTGSNRRDRHVPGIVLNRQFSIKSTMAKQKLRGGPWERLAAAAAAVAAAAAAAFAAIAVAAAAATVAAVAGIALLLLLRLQLRKKVVPWFLDQ